mmetsp:Transcript_24812/g.61865  ORF Transcript_24812/g.61865 Transcript_24812/m.61865 type:complete len:94 (-) Transcript_24812:41-322(-)
MYTTASASRTAAVIFEFQSRSIDLCKQSAAGGDAEACNRLGKFYFTGEIPDLVAKDHKTSLEWFLKAASQNGFSKRPGNCTWAHRRVARSEGF